MSEFWLVSAPGDPRPEDTWTLIKDKTSSLSVNYKFHIPSELKVVHVDSVTQVPHPFRAQGSACGQCDTSSTSLQNSGQCMWTV